MSVKTEENQMPTKQQSCLINKDGIALFGFKFSWLVVILIVIAIFYYLNSNNMLSENVSSVFDEPPRLSTTSPSYGSSTMTGGGYGKYTATGPYKMNVKPGELAQMLNLV